MSCLLVLSLSCLLALADAHGPFADRPPCGNSGRTCISTEATCVGNKCVCDKLNGFLHGRADFRCYPDDTIHCEFKGDPTVITYSKELEDFPLPCRYLATHLSTQMKDRQANVIGSCEVKVYGYNGKLEGKTYVEGFDVTIKLQYKHNPVEVIASLRHQGYVKYKNNIWSKGGAPDQWDRFDSGDGTFEYFNPNNGVKLSFNWDSMNNRFIYSMDGCGVKVIHVPYDTLLKHRQRQVPGLSIGVRRDHDPTYLSNDKVMCLAPPEKGGSLFKDIKEGPLDTKQSLLLRAFLAQVPQHHIHSERFSTGGGSFCRDIGKTLGSCQMARKRKAAQNCFWMLKDVQFSKCMCKRVLVIPLLETVDLCVQAWCNNTPCTEAINNIKFVYECDKIGNVPNLAPFLSGSMCPRTNSEGKSQR